MKKQYFYVIKPSRTKRIEIPIKNVETLEECDKHIARSYKNKEDLYTKLTGYEFSPNVRVTIKEVTKYKDENGKKVQKTRDNIYPIYQELSTKDILKLCRYIISNPSIVKHSSEFYDIKDMMKKDDITYDDIRECYFLLRQIGIDLKKENNISEESINEEDSTREKKTKIYRLGIENYNFPNEETKEYAKELKRKVLSATNNEGFTELYQELLDFLGGYEYNNPLSKKRH